MPLHCPYSQNCLQIFGALIHSIMLLSSQVAFYLYKSNLHPCMECYCHAWDGSTSYHFDMLDKLGKKVCSADGLVLPASLEFLAFRNESSLNIFHMYDFGRWSSELFPFPCFRGMFTLYSKKLHNFSSTIPRCYEDAYFIIFFPYTNRL